MKATKPWGIALERLRLQRKPEEIGITSKKVIEKGEVTYRQLAVNGIAGQTDWTRWLTGPQGPTVASLDKFLTKMGYNWHDWARAIESEKTAQQKALKKKPPDQDGRKFIAATGTHR